MIVLAVDTSTRYAAVAVADEESVLGETSWYSRQNHGAELLPAAIAALEECGLTMRDVTHLGIALGPGGFSALRVGMGTVKGIALPRGLPVAGISTFDVEAAPHFQTRAPLYAVVPAGRGEVAWAYYGDEPDDQRERKAKGLDAPEGLVALSSSGARFCGEGVELLAERVDSDAVLSGPPPTRSAGTLALLACARFARGEADDVNALEPAYARAPSISTPKSPRA